MRRGWQINGTTRGCQVPREICTVVHWTESLERCTRWLVEDPPDARWMYEWPHSGDLRRASNAMVEGCRRWESSEIRRIPVQVQTRILIRSITFDSYNEEAFFRRRTNTSHNCCNSQFAMANRDVLKDLRLYQARVCDGHPVARAVPMWALPERWGSVAMRYPDIRVFSACIGEV